MFKLLKSLKRRPEKQNFHYQFPFFGPQLWETNAVSCITELVNKARPSGSCECAPILNSNKLKSNNDLIWYIWLSLKKKCLLLEQRPHWLSVVVSVSYRKKSYETTTGEDIFRVNQYNQQGLNPNQLEEYVNFYPFLNMH